MRLTQSILAFGTVGLLATVVHVVVGLALTEARLLRPFSANLVAFLLAFVVSYAGHRRFTFRSGVSHARALPRFFATVATGLVLNQSIVYLAVDVLGWDYIVALAIVVTIVPVLVYLVLRHWTFRETDA
jgi:putative flippase GtrA